jgi:hypothetical protein
MGMGYLHVSVILKAYQFAQDSFALRKWLSPNIFSVVKHFHAVAFAPAATRVLDGTF